MEEPDALTGVDPGSEDVDPENNSMGESGASASDHIHGNDGHLDFHRGGECDVMFQILPSVVSALMRMCTSK